MILFVLVIFSGLKNFLILAKLKFLEEFCDVECYFDCLKATAELNIGIIVQNMHMCDTKTVENTHRATKGTMSF